ncbi:MAG: ORF6N domain-containing protein [Pseudomonadota bacterium]
MSPKLRHVPQELASSPKIEPRIFEIRSQRVILDSDLAALYGVSTMHLNQQVRRNLDRFPIDFAFQLKYQDVRNLISQIVISSSAEHGGRRKLPLVFTEYGAIMAANVLKSERAILVSVQVVRAFTRLREMLNTHAQLAKKLDALERKYDSQFKVVFEAIRELMRPPTPPRRRIGFQT